MKHNLIAQLQSITAQTQARQSERRRGYVATQSRIDGERALLEAVEICSDIDALLIEAAMTGKTSYDVMSANSNLELGLSPVQRHVFEILKKARYPASLTQVVGDDGYGNDTVIGYNITICWKSKTKKPH